MESLYNYGLKDIGRYMNNIDFKYSHQTFPGNILLEWMTQKRYGTINEFREGLSNILYNNVNLENVKDSEIYDLSNYLLNDLSSLLHIEYNEKNWYVAPPSLNLFDGLSKKAFISGARSPEIYSLLEKSKNIESFYFVDNSRTFPTGFNTEYLRSNFIPPSIIISYEDNKLSKIAEEFSLNIVDTKAIDFLRSLPSISNLVEIASTWNFNKGLEVQRLEGFRLEFKRQDNLISTHQKLNGDFSSVFKHTRPTLEGFDENILHRVRESRENWAYFVSHNGNNKKITKEVGLWFSLAQRQKQQDKFFSPNYLFLCTDDLPNPSITIPINLKLPLIYAKALNLCSGILPELYRPEQLFHNSDKIYPVFAKYFNISKEFIDVLIEKLELDRTSIGRKKDNKVYYENELFPGQKNTLREKFKNEAYKENYYLNNE